MWSLTNLYISAVQTTHCDREARSNTRVPSTGIYSAFTDKPEHNCHFPAPGRNCMTHSQVLQDFLDKSQVSLHKNSKINQPFFRGAESDVPVTV
jgi:hypothetical protein